MLLRKLTNTIVILSLLSLSRMSLAATYYVDPKGDDNNGGSQNNPFATIQKAIDEANDGTSTNYDVVHVNSGTYTTGPIILSNDNQRIEFRDGQHVSLTSHVYLRLLTTLKPGDEINYHTDNTNRLLLWNYVK